MKFQYYPNDPMDEVPAPVGKLVFSFVGITAIFVGYTFLWGFFIS
jgi:hypothetical protein